MNPSVAVTHTSEPGGRHVADITAAVGTSIQDTMPASKGLLVCRLNGGPGFVSRANWEHRLQPGDVLEWLDYPAGGKGDGDFLQTLFTFAAAIYTENPYLVLALFAGQALNFFTDVAAPPEELQKTSPTYATGIQGNQARLYQVVPKICGRMKTYPPFAAQPYSEFDADTGEQFLYVLMALGIGNHDIERVMIDDTDINHFSDILTLTYLPPGSLPTQVHANVINAPEVGSQDLLTGEFVGGFAACGPRTLATAIGIDVVGPRGIGLQDGSGDLSGLEVKWRVQIRSLNEFGSPITAWSVLANETRTVASREPQRWTVRYELDPPIRPEIRIVRTDDKSANVRALNDLTWSGMRAYLDGTAPLNADVAHFELVMRASKQLTGVSQNRVSVIATAMVRELLSDLTFGAEIASRNPADSLADLWTSTTWGEGLEAGAVDLQTLYALRTLWDARQDRFDYVFDTSIDADAAAQIIAGAGRARCFRRGGVRTLARDQLITLPRTAFTTRNTQPGSMVTNEQLPRTNVPDGVIIEYFDNRSWNYGQPLECPCPGVVSMTNPVRIRKDGVTGRTHAKREGLYEAAKIALRRQSVEAVTEMQGSLPAFGSAVRWQSEISRWQSGDVFEWTPGTLTAALTEPPNWGDAPRYIVLIRDDGSPTEPIAISPGPSGNEVVLASAPDFTPVTEDGTRERTQYLLGGLADDELLVKISSIQDAGRQNGAQLYKIAAFVDDDRIHAADNAYLPSPGEIQDPIDTSEGEPGGGTEPIVSITNQIISFSDSATYSLRNTGHAHIFFTGAGSGSGDDDIAHEWLVSTPVEVDVAALFEARATNIGGTTTITPAIFDVWLSLDTNRDWSTTDFESPAVIKIEIRDVDTATIQDTAIIQFLVV